MSEFSSLVQAYYQNPLNNRKIDWASVSRHEGNSICGDDLIVYLTIEDDKITDRSYEGMPSMITQAAASFFSELVIGKTVNEVLRMNEQTMRDQEFIVSPRRRRASVTAILATRNALHEYLQDGKRDEFEDLLVD